MKTADALYLAQLATPVGRPGSGAARYGAAMQLYQAGQMSAELLEVYRMCYKFDAEDPLRVAAYEGVETEGNMP